MLVLDRAKPIEVDEAVALRQRIGVFGIAPYIGGPCAADIWPADLCLRLLDQGFPMAGYWVGSNTGCWIARYDAQTGQQHAQRAMQDAHVRALDKAPIILDVERNTWYNGSTERPGVREYMTAFAEELTSLGGVPWDYGNGDMIRAMGAIFRGFVLASWTQTGDYRPVPADPPRAHGHQYANQVSDLLSSGNCDCSVINEADLFSRPIEVNGMKVDSPVIDSAPAPNGGLWLLTQTGAVYALNAPYHGGLNPGNPDHDQPVGSPRTITAFGDGYIITTDQGRTYAFNCPSVPGADEIPDWAH